MKTNEDEIQKVINKDLQNVTGSFIFNLVGTILTTIFYFLIGQDPQPSLFTDNYLQSIVILGHFFEYSFILSQINFLSYSQSFFISMPFKQCLHPSKTILYWKKILILLFTLTSLLPTILDISLAQFSNPNSPPTNYQIWVRLYHNVWWVCLNVHQAIVTIHYKKQVKANKKLNLIANLQILLVTIKSIGSLEHVYWLISNFLIQVGAISNSQKHGNFNMVKNLWAFTFYIPQVILVFQIEKKIQIALKTYSEISVTDYVNE